MGCGEKAAEPSSPLFLEAMACFACTIYNIIIYSIPGISVCCSATQVTMKRGQGFLASHGWLEEINRLPCTLIAGIAWVSGKGGGSVGESSVFGLLVPKFFASTVKLSAVPSAHPAVNCR